MTKSTQEAAVGVCLMHVRIYDAVWNHTTSAALFKGTSDDVVAYDLAGDHDADTIKERGHRLTEREARAVGLNWPHYYRYRR